jgi:hypothetical protein
VKRLVAVSVLVVLALAAGCGQRRVVIDPESVNERQMHDWYIQREPAQVQAQAPAPDPDTSAERKP